VISRRTFITTAGVGFLATPLAAEAHGSTFTFTIPVQRGE